MKDSDSFDQKARDWDQQAYRVRRAAEVAARIRERVPLGPGVRAVDFGCGTGLLGMELVGSVGHLVFADTSSGMLDQVARKVADRGLPHATTHDLTQGALVGPFDLMFSLMVLHHIDDVPAQIDTLAGLLGPGGFLCLADLDHEDGSFHAPDTVPHNGFHRREVEGWVAATGLTVVDTCTGFVNTKVVGTQEREFPVFLVTARRPAP